MFFLGNYNMYNENASLFGADYASEIACQVVDEWSTWRNSTDDLIIDTPYSCGYTLRDYVANAVNEYKALLLSDKQARIMLSGGKDSTACVILLIIALMEIKRAGLLGNVIRGNVIASANTRTENPKAAKILLNVHRDLQKFISDNELPLTLILAEPNTTQTLIGRVVTGRGLPSYPSKPAQCSVERKQNPVNSAVVKFYQTNNINGKKTILVLGSRERESASRQASTRRFGATNTVKRSSKGKYEFYPVLHWGVDQIWDLLNNSGTSKKLPSFSANFEELADFYRDATGECNYVQKEQEKVAEQCSARTGCFDCLRVSADKSAEQLATLEEYSYLKPLLRIRQFLSNIEKDWSRRNLLGRTLYSGFSRLRPDVFDFDTCKTLYAALITADVDEEERAYQVALKIENGELPDTETNRHLAKPQFRHVTPKDVITVEWLWSLHTFTLRNFH